MSFSDGTCPRGASSGRDAKRRLVRPAWLRPAALSLASSAHARVVSCRQAPTRAADAARRRRSDAGAARRRPRGPEEESRRSSRPRRRRPPPLRRRWNRRNWPRRRRSSSRRRLSRCRLRSPGRKSSSNPSRSQSPWSRKRIDRPTPAELRAEARKREEAPSGVVRRRRREPRREEARRRGGAVAAACRAATMPACSPRNCAGINSIPLRRARDGVTGSVGVAFTVGASGRVVSQSITRSSGNSALDGAARAMMSAVHTPPPPGGSFSTSTTIQFNLN